MLINPKSSKVNMSDQSRQNSISMPGGVYNNSSSKLAANQGQKSDKESNSKDKESGSSKVLTFARGLTRNSPFDIITAGKADSNRHKMQSDL